ncbi:hypothetical protein PGT21_032758 [Puccinia graminis f. sp. tritici]|uniref:Uncharacterized protein n=1 Tax=Puccinia graminis f. sp. tritici TaxID=56615 RepID=A0A5B0PMF5_PUCGR|nr:hypothetical protein PGT21_032758 [Puccinia graminis f. sp. tritici]
MTLFFGSSCGSLCYLTSTRLLLFLSTIATIQFIEASPFRHSDSTSQTDSSNHQSFQHNFNSISNMASMKGYLKPRCSRSSLSNTISLQDCYGALSQLPFNASDSLSLSRPVSQSANTCSLTVSKVTEKNADPSDQASIVNVYAPTLFGPVGQILTSCSNQVE